MELLTPDKVEERGQRIYKCSKIGMFIGACGILLLLIICLSCLANDGDFLDPIIFDLRSRYAWAYVFVAIADIAIFIGIASIPMYFIGLSIYALGRIARNTEKE